MIGESRLLTTKRDTWIYLTRVARFGDVDAAGVLHFYQLFRWCHESWEESLELFGIPSKNIFPNNKQSAKFLECALPVVQCEAEFWLPIETGDTLFVEISPIKLNSSSFRVETKFKRDGKDVAKGTLRHVSINSLTRRRCSLPDDIDRWLKAST